MTHIQVFIPGYNIESHIFRCLETVAAQDYTDFSVCMVDDASTDLTGKIMEASKLGTVIHNQNNLKMPHNLVYVRPGRREDVIFLLDGDDFLPHENVLSQVASHFEDPDLWLMYGSYVRHPDPTLMPNPALPFPADVVEENAFRTYSKLALIYNHPLVFRRALFWHVKNWEMQDDDGQWFTHSYDHSIMMPMLELASNGHFKWCPDVLYTYNEENPDSEAKGDRQEGIRVHNIVNARTPRTPL